MRPVLRRLAFAHVALAGACSAPDAPDEAADPSDETFGSGKADGLCVAEGSAAAVGVLALVNDPDVDVEELDVSTSQGGAGLNRTAAQNIVAARPIADLDELDAVPYVGVTACQALASYACNEQRRCLSTLDVMTWNIEHFPKSSVTEDAATDILDELGPDLVGVQEIESVSAFERVADGLDGYGWIVGKKGDTRVGMLYRSDTIEIVDVEHLFQSDWFAFPRPVLAVTVRLRDALEPTELLFVVVHLKALSGAENEDRRRDGVEKLREWIDDRRAAGDTNIVVVGDWNDRIEEPASTNVFTALLDASADVDFLTAALPGQGEFSYVPFESLIDHVVVTDATLDALVEPTTTVLHLDETWSGGDYLDEVSDHRPVRTRFGLPIGW